ncbi:MAG: hypothetical protein ACT4NL_15545 [Pseudomarimonas sp.]
MTPISTQHALLVSADHPCLAGHFPGNPIVPGVVILDAVLAAARLRFGTDCSLQRLPQVKFLQPLLPGQAASIELTAVATEADAQRLRFRLLRSDEVLSSGELLFTTAESTP